MPKLPIAGDEERGTLTEPPLLAGLPGFAGKFIPMEQARELYRRVRAAPQGFRLEALLAEMKVKLEVQPADLDRIPVKGPLVAVANHPFGVLDGVALAVLLSRARPDVKILTNALLQGIPELHEHCIFVDPFHTPSSADKNVKPLKQALEWLRRGGALAVFPAGEVSQWNIRQAQVTDPAWNTVAARLVRKTGASALPVYFCGRNSVTFQLLGLINPRLRTLFLLQEFLQQREKDVQVRIGGAIPSELIGTSTTTRKPPSIFVCELTCCRIAAGSRSRCPPRCAPRFRASRRSRSLPRFHRDSSSTILRRYPPTGCSSRTRISLCTPRALLSCPTSSMSSDASAKSPSAPPARVPGAAPTSISSMLITGTFCSGIRRSRNWPVLIVPATRMRSFAATASRDSTRTPCSATTSNCS